MSPARKRRTPAAAGHSPPSPTETEAQPTSPVDHAEPAEGTADDRSDVEHEHVGRDQPGDIERDIQRGQGDDARDVERDAGPSTEPVD